MRLVTWNVNSIRRRLPRLLAMLEPTPPFQALILSELSRLGRDPYDTPHYIKKILKAGVRIFSYLDDEEITLHSLRQTQAHRVEHHRRQRFDVTSLAERARAADITRGLDHQQRLASEIRNDRVPPVRACDRGDDGDP